MRSGFFSIIAVSDAVTTGETCRSISPLRGSTLGGSRYGFGAGEEASFFFIQPFIRQWITIRAYRSVFPHLKDHRLGNPDDIRQVDRDSRCRSPRRRCARPGPCQSNIARRIADYINLSGGKLAAVSLICARASERSEPVTISMIIGERAKLKKVPDTVMLELELRAAGYIASKKRQHEMRP